MDKRYFLIILIIVICCINLYLVANVSDVVGSAYVDVGNYTLTMPEGFALSEDKSNQAIIYNSNSNTQITILSSLGQNDTFTHKYNEINGSQNFKILSNGTINNKDIIINSMFYQNVKTLENRSTFYFNIDNHDFRILISGFNYDSEKNKTIDLASKMIDSIRFNYKL